MKRSMLMGCIATLVLVAVIGITACGGSTATSNQGSAASPAAGAGGSVQGVPFYQPSTVRSHVGDSATLTSPDSVTKVSDFYVNVADKAGWTIQSKSVSPFNGNLTIKKSDRGATISVAPSGAGSLITISTYRT
jgi:hypothetical protein